MHVPLYDGRADRTGHLLARMLVCDRQATEHGWIDFLLVAVAGGGRCLRGCMGALYRSRSSGSQKWSEYDQRRSKIVDGDSTKFMNGIYFREYPLEFCAILTKSGGYFYD